MLLTESKVFFYCLLEVKIFASSVITNIFGDDSSFSILSCDRSKYHLEVLEALCTSKYQPKLCVQKNLLALYLFEASRQGNLNVDVNPAT